jgi:hypothetical protein
MISKTTQPIVIIELFVNIRYNLIISRMVRLG